MMETNYLKIRQPLWVKIKHSKEKINNGQKFGHKEKDCRSKDSNQQEAKRAASEAKSNSSEL